MEYNFLATTKNGKSEGGTIEAGNKEEALRILSERGFSAISLKERDSKKNKTMINFGWVSSKEKLFFVKHLTVMIKAGLVISEALSVSKEQAKGRFKEILADVLEFVKKGNTLSSGLEKHPKIFPPIFVNLIKVGETSGTLEQSLEYLSLQLEKSAELQRKIIGAMMYPVLVLTATIGIGLVLATLVLPQIAGLLRSLEAELPFLTRVLLGIADLFAKYGWLILIGVILIGLFLILFFRQGFVKPFYHRFLFLLPIISGITRQVQLARFSRILGTFIKSGLPIDQSLLIIHQVTDNVIYQKIINQILISVDRGVPISEAIVSFEDDFPRIFSQMINVGERTGELANCLLYLAEFYEAEVDNTVKNLTNILEPILLVIVGIVVGAVALSIISPIYQFTGTLR